MFYNLALEYYKYTHLGLISKDPEGFGSTPEKQSPRRFLKPSGTNLNYK